MSEDIFQEMGKLKQEEKTETEEEPAQEQIIEYTCFTVNGLKATINDIGKQNKKEAKKEIKKVSSEKLFCILKMHEKYKEYLVLKEDFLKKAKLLKSMKSSFKEFEKGGENNG